MSSPRRGSAGAGAGIGRSSDIVRDDGATYEGLAIVEKYEQAIEYLYPIVQTAPRKHGAARDAVLAALFGQVELLIFAGKSRQPARLYAADANLALLRFWLRFMVHPSRKLISPHQHRVASIKLAEVGKMLGAWIKTAKRGG